MRYPYSLSVFFPAYNEEANIRSTVESADAVLQQVTNTYEIIIVNDGSTDKTGTIADTLAKENPHVRVVHHDPNKGYGAAVWTGIQAARYDYLFFTDADLQFDLKEIKKLLAFIPKYEVVLGYRAKRQDPFLRLVNAKGWNLLNRLLFGLKVRDIDCAFKLFKRQLLTDLPLRSRGAMLSAELLIHLQRQGIPFKEVPVTHLPRTAGSPTGAKPAVIARAFSELFQTYRGELGNPSHRQLVKFALVGAGNTILDLGLYFLLTRLVPYFGDHIIVAKALSFILASISSFLANRTWTFRRTTPITLSEIGRFYLTVGIAVVINILSLFVLLRAFNFFDPPAVLLATVATFAWNFTVSKLWVFTSREQPTPQRASFSWYPWLITAALVGILVNTWIWLKADSYPPHWDMANHLRNALIYSDALQAAQDSQTLGELKHALYEFLIGLETYYPPFAYWIAAPFVFVFGRSYDAITLSNTVFLLILSLSLYGIGKQLWNKQTGFLAMLVGLSYPFLATQFHEFQLDMPLTAMTAAALWCLLKTEQWRHSGWSFVFGLVSGLAMLTKWPALAFLIGPVLLEITRRALAIARAPAPERFMLTRLFGINLVVAGLGFLLAAGPWYLTHAKALKQSLAVNWQTGTGEGDPNPLSLSSFRIYIDVLVKGQIRLLMLIPLAIGILTTFLRKDNFKQNSFILAWVIGGYLVMTFYNNKDYRFIEPILGGLAILTTYWIAQLIQPWRTLMVATITLLALFQVLSTSWGATLFPTLPPKTEILLGPVTNRFPITIWEFMGYGSGPPRQANWQQEAIVHTINQDRLSASKESAFLAMYYKDNMEFNRENMHYAILQARAPLNILPGPPATFNCFDVDYIIATTDMGIAAAVKRDFAYVDHYYYNDKGPTILEGTRRQEPLCHLETLYESTLPNQSGVFVWKVKQ